MRAYSYKINHNELEKSGRNVQLFSIQKKPARQMQLHMLWWCYSRCSMQNDWTFCGIGRNGITFSLCTQTYLRLIDCQYKWIKLNRDTLKWFVGNVRCDVSLCFVQWCALAFAFDFWISQPTIRLTKILFVMCARYFLYFFLSYVFATQLIAVLYTWLFFVPYFFWLVFVGWLAMNLFHVHYVIRTSSKKIERTAKMKTTMSNSSGSHVEQSQQGKIAITYSSYSSNCTKSCKCARVFFSNYKKNLRSEEGV